MDIHKLKVFIAVYKNRSFSKAAEELLISQPTVTEHIRYLENFLKVKLFDRLGKNVLPTETGKLLFEKASNLIESFNNLKDEIKQELSGEIKIFASSVPGSYILPEILINFLNLHPEFVVNLHVSDSREVIKKIIEDEGLIGFVGTKLSDKSLEYRVFQKDEIILVGAKNYKIPQKITLENLKDKKIIIRESGSGTRREIEKFFEKSNISMENLKVNLILQNNEAIKNALLSSDYLSFVSKRSVNKEIEMGLLKEIKVEGVKIERAFYIVKKRGRTLPLRYEIFLNFLKNYIQTT